jgi:putative transcriptional regulator
MVGKLMTKERIRQELKSTASLAPGLLTAPPGLVERQFKRAVIALVAHDDDGALGFNLSRLGTLLLSDILKGLDLELKIDDRRVLSGGPVSKSSGFVLYEHPKGEPLSPGFKLGDSLSISPSLDLLELAAKGKLPGRFELILGYAGWGPGQLDAEMKAGGWLHNDVDPHLIFDVPLKQRWNRTFEDMGFSPYQLMNVSGGAQA